MIKGPSKYNITRIFSSFRLISSLNEISNPYSFIIVQSDIDAQKTLVFDYKKKVVVKRRFPDDNFALICKNNLFFLSFQ
jgi:hypothetical protein